MPKKSVRIPVIYYHSVAPKKKKNWILGFLTLELKYFEDQIRYFLRYNYETHFLMDYFLQKKGEKELDSRHICLTFDDGYLDNWLYVFPLLKKYGLKATIFINPEFVDPRDIVRKNLDDYWTNSASFKEIDQWGFLSWEEMRIMEKSGLIDVQSHTLTHTKYFVSDRLIDFHRPGADSVCLISNHFPGRKPFYIGDPDFENLIPFGFPKFEEESSMITRRVFINEEFNREVVKVLNDWDWTSDYAFEETFKKIKPVYQRYKNEGRLIVGQESDKEYESRIIDELCLSKEIIENKLDKKVYFCGWPSGDNNELVHQKALELGYLATTAGKRNCESNDFQCIPRFGLGKCKNNRFLTIQKTHYKLKSFQKKFPYYQIKKCYNYFKYGKGVSGY